MMKLIRHAFCLLKVVSVFALEMLFRVCSSIFISVTVVHLFRFVQYVFKTAGLNVSWCHDAWNWCGGTERIVIILSVIISVVLVKRHLLIPLHFFFKCISKRCRIVAPYIDDTPLCIDDEDLLGRKAFEDRVLHLIENAPVEDSAQYIGLWGRWGIGKTSCINRIEGRAKGKGFWTNPIFVHFNLMKYSGRSDLLGALFTEIGNSKWMKFYGVGGLFGAMGWQMTMDRITKISQVRHWISDIIKIIFYTFKGQGAMQHSLAKALKTIRRRVVIVVDDLERLPQDEICAVMRMLKSVGNLPYVTYVILASEPYLAAAVGSMMPNSSEDNQTVAGREYLTKLVPDSVELPDITDKGLLEKYFTREIEKFVRLYWYNFDMSNTSFCFVMRIVDTIRDVKRLVNAVHSALEEQRTKNGGVGVSVNLEDLIMLQAVRLKWPDFYDALPEMYGFFWNKGSIVCTDEMIRGKYLKFVPRQDWETAQMFLREYLRIKRKQEFTGHPNKMQWCWEIEDPEDYKLYEEYRLASIYCFENYFTTQFPRRMVSKIQFVTACECVESYDVAKLVTTMLDVDENRSLPELLFLIEMKYGEGTMDMGWTILRALARISDKRLVSSSARYGQAVNAASVYKDIVRHARAGLIRIEKTKKSALARLIAEEKDSVVLFAGLIFGDYDDNFEAYIKGEDKEPFRLGTVADIKKLAEIVRDRINVKMSDGSFEDVPWACAALMQINDFICGFGIKEGGLTTYRPNGFDFIPSIEIVMQDDGCEERLLKTFRSVVLSIDAYHGPVRSRIHVMIKTGVNKRDDLIKRLQAGWPGLEVIVDDKMPNAEYMWVVFVRAGDIVAKEWFSVLSHESFYTSLDIVSFNFYTFYFEVIFGNRLKTIENTTNVSQYMQPLIELNKAAAGFWNKMYKATLLSGIPYLPENASTDNAIVIGLLLKCKKIAHVDKYLLGHRIDLRDVARMSESLICGLNEDGTTSVWNMRTLKGSVYSDDTFRVMVESLRKSLSWKVLYKPLMHFRIIDEVCPKTWRLRRVRLWICCKMPWMSAILFPRNKKVA